MMDTLEKIQNPNKLIYLPVLAFCVDLFTPFLIWKGIIPAEIRWLSHLTIAIMILVTIFRMLIFNHIPRSFLLMLIVAIIWATVALRYGQGILPTAWGLWLLFQFPLVGLFAYLQPNQPKVVSEYVQKFSLIILSLEVGIQLVQYAFGEPVGDNLAGFFGKNGTGNAVIFAIMVNCLYLGIWINKKHWRGLVFAMLLGAISSVLGEMKLFPYALAISGFLAVLIYANRHRTLHVVFTYAPLILTVALGFVYVYNQIVPGATRVPFQTYLESPAALSRYLNRADSYSTSRGLYTDIGRGYALSYGLESIQESPMTLLFGFGLGARSESRTLGTAGIGLTTGGLGLSVGTSLLILMQEMGLVGLILLGIFILWIINTLVSDIRRYPTSPATSLRYGLLFSSILWPIWLWYANVWTMRVPMLLYWYLLGYVLSESHNLSDRLQHIASFKTAFYGEIRRE
jgi:hypothetical protein